MGVSAWLCPVMNVPLQQQRGRHSTGAGVVTPEATRAGLQLSYLLPPPAQFLDAQALPKGPPGYLGLCQPSSCPPSPSCWLLPLRTPQVCTTTTAWAACRLQWALAGCPQVGSGIPSSPPGEKPMLVRRRVPSPWPPASPAPLSLSPSFQAWRFSAAWVPMPT